MTYLQHLICKLLGHKEIALGGVVLLCLRCDRDNLKEYQRILRRPSGMVECQENCSCPRGGSYRRNYS